MIYIETDRLILRPLRLEDAESVFEYATDPEVTTYVTWDAHKTIDDSKTYIEMAMAEQQKTPLYPLAIVFKDNPDQVIGTVGIKTGSHAYEADLSYIIARKHWRKGLMFEATSALVNLAFAEYGFKRIYAWCIKENNASSSLMKKLGMKFEGYFRSKTFRRERFWDVEYYAILEDEWRQPRSLNIVENNELNVSFSTISHPDLDKKMSDGLYSELHTLTQLAGDDFKTHNIYAHIQDNFVGGAIILKYGDILWLDSIWVEPDHRTLGVGKQIMQEVFAQARHSNVQKIQLNTFFPEAHDFFLKCGFEDVAIIPDWKYGLTCYLMQRKL